MGVTFWLEFLPSSNVSLCKMCGCIGFVAVMDRLMTIYVSKTKLKVSGAFVDTDFCTYKSL